MRRLRHQPEESVPPHLEVTDTVYLWCGQVMSSFEELTTAICADLDAKVCLAMSRT